MPLSTKNLEDSRARENHGLIAYSQYAPKYSSPCFYAFCQCRVTIAMIRAQDIDSMIHIFSTVQVLPMVGNARHILQTLVTNLYTNHRKKLNLLVQSQYFL